MVCCLFNTPETIMLALGTDGRYIRIVQLYGWKAWNMLINQTSYPGQRLFRCNYTELLTLCVVSRHQVVTNTDNAPIQYRNRPSKNRNTNQRTRPSYIIYSITYTDKTASLYGFGPRCMWAFVSMATKFRQHDLTQRTHDVIIITSFLRQNDIFM